MTVLFLQITNKHKSRQRLILRKVILDVSYSYRNSLKSAKDQHPLSRDPCLGPCQPVSGHSLTSSQAFLPSPNIDMIHFSVASLLWALKKDKDAG